MTSPFSPYQPPQADADSFDRQPSDDSTSHLATRSQRWWAAFIDGWISIAILGPLQYKFGFFHNFPNIQKPTPLVSALWGAIGFAIYCLVHGYFLFKYSQTVGKRVMKIRVENLADGQRTPGWQLLVVRALPISAFEQIPVVGPWLGLFDVVFIFRKNRRCLHDYWAGTVVVKTR
ncbi:MAG: RDD family protein [Polyangiaceae bacterium]